MAYRRAYPMDYIRGKYRIFISPETQTASGGQEGKVREKE